MIPGLMQRAPLLIGDILSFAAKAHARREIVSRLVDEPIWRYDYAGLAERVGRAANMMLGLGLQSGQRVTSLAWNTHRHLELFYAAPGLGLVLHTANPRLSDDQIVYTINHAGSEILFFDKSFLPLVARLRARLDKIDRFIMLSAGPGFHSDGIDIVGYEELLAESSADMVWPDLNEDAASFLCYTSGTTGDPKGVLYSHRSVVLHAMAASLNSALGLSAFDCLMPCQSLYHATAWGLPFAGPMNGCKIVLPCEKFDGASIQELIQQEGVTFSGGVPTIWTMYLDYLERTGEDSGSLERLIIGGSAVPRAMAETFENRYGVKVRQIWGMTETSPLGVISTPTPQLADKGDDAVRETVWTRQGRLHFGTDLKLIDEHGGPIPFDGQQSGALMVRGPWTIERYFRHDETALDAGGWFNTGDIAAIDEDGFMRITDREKDVIKSGGEWVSSIDIENAAVAYPGVKIAAVVGVYHPKWEERPILCLECHEGAEISEEEIRAFLTDKIVKWWMPDAVVFDSVPLTATGKIDKKIIREKYCDIFR